MNLSKQRGVSLIELMVAITIGLILMAGVLSIFLSSKVTYMANEKTARLQENGRVALDLIQHDVRSAGFMGCARAVPFTSTLNSATSLLWNYQIPLQGFESSGSGTWSPALAAGTLNPAPINDSDVLVTRAVQRDGISRRVELDNSSFTGDARVLSAVDVPVGTIMLITDCQAASVFQVTGYAAGTPATISHGVGGSTPGNATDDLGWLYLAGSRVTPLETVTYYVANDPVTGEPSLYRQTGATQPADLLIEGVQALQISYAEDTNGDRIADVHRSATTVGNWNNVLSVSLAMLIRSEQTGTDVDAQTYQLLPAAVGGRLLGPYNDRRMRMVFTTTVALRNRAL
jgi:type IV pilus assembly protein PilW